MSIKSDVSAQLTKEIKARRKLQEAQLNASVVITKEKATRDELRGRRALVAQAQREADFISHPAVT